MGESWLCSDALRRTHQSTTSGIAVEPSSSFRSESLKRQDSIAERSTQVESGNQEHPLTKSFSRSATKQRDAVINRGEAMRRVFFGRNLKEHAAAKLQVVRGSWSCLRRNMAVLIEHQGYSVSMTVLVMLNIMQVIVDTNQRSVNGKADLWVTISGHMFLLIYIFDLTCKIYVARQEFHHSTTNVFDFCIVFIDCVVATFELATGGQGLPSIAVFRVVRVLRIVRVLRNFAIFRELYLMLRGLLSALRAILFATLLILVVLAMFSIMAVEVLNPLSRKLYASGAYSSDCKRCEHAFRTVEDSILTFFQTIIAGDSWGLVAVPLIEHYPYRSLLILTTALVTVQLGLLNVIIAVIVDRQAQAREDDQEFIYTMKQEALFESYNNLMQIFETIDLDKSGTLTVDELKNSFESCAPMREIMVLLDITTEDMGLVFSMLDKNDDGVVDFEEFVEQLHSLRWQNSHTLLMFTRQLLYQVKADCAKQFSIIGAKLDQLAKLDSRRSEAVERGMKDLLQDGLHSYRSSAPPPCSARSPLQLEPVVIRRGSAPCTMGTSLPHSLRPNKDIDLRNQDALLQAPEVPQESAPLRIRTVRPASCDSVLDRSRIPLQSQFHLARGSLHNVVRIEVRKLQQQLEASLTQFTANIVKQLDANGCAQDFADFEGAWEPMVQPHNLSRISSLVNDFDNGYSNQPGSREISRCLQYAPGRSGNDDTACPRKMFDWTPCAPPRRVDAPEIAK